MKLHKRVIAAATGFLMIVALTGILFALDTPGQTLAAGLTASSASSDIHHSNMTDVEHEALMVAAQVSAPNGGFDVHAQLGSTLNDFALPGTQPGGIAGSSFGAATACTGCHSPTHIKDDYAGSMMTNGMRDPLFRAALVIANKDAGFGGELCIRCHSPNAFLFGRAHTVGDPSSTDGRLINSDDLNGIPCMACHRMAPPAPLSGEASGDAAVRSGLTGPFIVGSAAYLIDTNDIRRGPFDTSGTAPHATQQSSFLRSAELCATCHDIDNPLLSFNSGSKGFKLNTPDTAAPASDRLFPLDRSYSEWAASDFNPDNGGLGVSGLTYPGLKRSDGTTNGPITVCQDCHMPLATGPLTGGGADRTVGAHQWVGANTEWQDAIVDKWGTVGGDTQFNSAQTTADKALGQDLLKQAAQLDVNVVNGQLEVKVTNNTGHKLPTGYTEGRRMWIEVYELNGATTVFTSGLLGGAVGPMLPDPYQKVYEAHMGLSADQAQATGLPEGESFHIILNNKIFKDNRIPPRGFTNAAFAARDMQPVGATYADGQYWDTTYYPLDPRATEVSVALKYQTASGEYVDFLSNAANFDAQDGVAGTVNWGQFIATESAKGIGKPFVIASKHLAFPREYVATTGTDTGSCDNSAQPCKTISYAINVSSGFVADSVDIRVAAGVYPEAVIVTRTLSLSGGFTLTNWITPTWTVNKTIIDGQNAFRPVTVLANNSTVSGFTIRNGNATNSGPAGAEQNGGGIYIGGVNQVEDATLFNLRLENNLANNSDGSGDGGGIYTTMGNTFFITGTLTLNNVTVVNNTASTGHLSSGGGGMSISAAGNSALNVDMTNVTVQGNTGGNDFSSTGGGIEMSLNKGTATIHQSHILNNRAAAVANPSLGGASKGGGIFLGDGDLLLENVLIARNQGDRGNAMWIETSSAPSTTIDLNYVTIANNGTNDAIRLVGPHDVLNLANTLISGGSTAVGAQDNDPQPPVVNFLNSFVDNNVTTLVSPTVTANGAPVRGSAAFVNAGGGNFHLTAASGAIDKGNDQPPLADLDGKPRPSGPHSDDGAYEFQKALQNQTITFNPLPDKLDTDAPFNLNASATSGLPVSFTSITTSVCTVSGKTVTLVASGTCTIKATQGGNGQFNPAPPVSRSFAVKNSGKTNQTITFNPLGNKQLGDPPFTVSATANSGLPVSFASDTPGVCTVAGNTVTLVAAGTCSITATQNGDATRNPATPVTRSFTVSTSGGGGSKEEVHLPALSKHP